MYMRSLATGVSTLVTVYMLFRRASKSIAGTGVVCMGMFFNRTAKTAIRMRMVSFGLAAGSRSNTTYCRGSGIAIPSSVYINVFIIRTT